MPLQAGEWIERLREEYLSEFLPSGGAAVKIALTPPHAAAWVLDQLGSEARKQGFFVAQVDAGHTRVHMIDQVFTAVARQADWGALTDRWLRHLLRQNGIEVSEAQPLHDLDALASLGGASRTDLFGVLHRLIDNSLGRNYAMSRDFRNSMKLLAWGQLNPQNVSPSDADVIRQWLLGEKCSLATLKRLQIYSRIGRHNARMLLASLAVWLHEVGYAGLALLMDLRAVVDPSPPAEHLVRYTRSTALDVYEVLRQSIDDVDETSYLLLGIVAGPGLVDDPKRSIDNYTALKMRIIDEVRDRNRTNPLNALVRLGNEGGAARGS